MKAKLVYSFCLLLTHVISIGIIMNSLYEWVALLATIVYVILATFFIQKSYGDRSSVIFSLVYSIAVFISSFIAFYYRNNVIVLMNWLFPIFGLCTPFTGLIFLDHLLRVSLELVPVIVSAFWCIQSITLTVLTIKAKTTNK